MRGLSRRLTQVNTQISMPMLMSSKGYGVLWNNYGMTEFNPSEKSVRLDQTTPTRRLLHEDAIAYSGGETDAEVVDVTSTEGNKKEVR